MVLFFLLYLFLVDEHEEGLAFPCRGQTAFPGSGRRSGGDSGAVGFLPPSNVSGGGPRPPPTALV